MSTINSAFLPQFFFALFTWKKTYRKGFRMYRFGNGHTWMELIWYIFSCHQIFSPFLFLSLCSHYRKISLDTINESHLFINEHPVESNFLLDKFYMYIFCRQRKSLWIGKLVNFLISWDITIYCCWQWSCYSGCPFINNIWSI